MLKKVIRSVVFVAATLSTFDAAFAASRFMMPQPMPSSGPWFEGWYVRVTDVEQGRSFATITTTSTEKEVPLKDGQTLPGYVAFLINKSVNDGATHSVEYFPQETSMIPDNSDPNESHFTWSSPGYGLMTDQQLALRLPSGDEISVAFGARLPWSQKWSTWGPGGWATYVPFMPLAWYVDSLGTPVSYRVKLGATGEVLEGRGYAHIEKNWGRVFPKAWMWTQATSSDNAAHVAIAGGPLQVGPVEMTSYLIGYKTKNLDIEIRPDQVVRVKYKTVIDSCKGDFQLVAQNARYRIYVRATAPVTSFAPVSIPTKEGFKPNRGKESFVAHIQVTVYRDGHFVETREFDGGALEFGAANMKCAADGSQSSAATAAGN